MNVNTPLSVSAALLAGVLCSSSLLAAPPGTRTPDQMVNLQIDKNTLCPVYGFEVNQQVNPDGTLSPFTIPEGYSLMITGLNWYQNMRSGNGRFEGRLSIQGTAAATIFADFRYDSGSSFQGGSVSGITDVVVRPGVHLCYGMPEWGAFAIVLDVRANVHGYLVKDRSSGSNDNSNNDGGNSKGGGPDWKSR